MSEIPALHQRSERDSLICRQLFLWMLQSEQLSIAFPFLQKKGEGR